jgi:hypothetical protein
MRETTARIWLELFSEVGSMVEEELLKRLRAMGVKSFSHVDGDSFQVEFYPVTPTIPAPDYDTLVPPPPATGETEPEVKVPPAIARLLKNGSVS